jgi:hypothetical protein
LGQEDPGIPLKRGLDRLFERQRFTRTGEGEHDTA